MTFDGEAADYRRAFRESLVECVDAVYVTAGSLLEDHRGEYPWVTGYLGEAFAPVWFVAENPSLTQVQTISDTSPEAGLQWTMTRGDHLFRDLLFKHGFKGERPDSPGDWYCYITDVIKSAAKVKDHNARLATDRRALAEAWAPVLEFELTHGRPRIIVCVGNRAETLLNHLIRTGLITDPVEEWDAVRERIPHYAYVASRPRRGLPGGHPKRIAEYDAQFAAIARARDALPRVLRVTDGRTIRVGTREEVDQAKEAIIALTGGSSLGGQLSYLFGDVLFAEAADAIVQPRAIERIASEAAGFLDLADVRLSGSARVLLARLAELDRA